MDSKTKRGQKQRGQLVFRSSAGRALRLQTASPSICLIKADTGERGGAAGTVAPSHSPPPGQRAQMAQALFAQDPGSPSDGGLVARHSPRADVTWPLRCKKGAVFFYVFNIHSLRVCVCVCVCVSPSLSPVSWTAVVSFTSSTCSLCDAIVPSFHYVCCHSFIFIIISSFVLFSS